MIGCTAIALRPDRAGQLRWVLVEHSARGKGLGRQLVETAIDYSVDSGCDHIYLESTDGLPESRALYDALGFELQYSESQELWDGERTLIRMQKYL